MVVDLFKFLDSNTVSRRHLLATCIHQCIASKTSDTAAWHRRQLLAGLVDERPPKAPCSSTVDTWAFE